MWYKGTIGDATRPSNLRVLASPMVLTVIFVSSTGGIVTGYFLKHLDAIRRTIASAIEVFICVLAAWLLFGVPLTAATIVAAGLVGTGVCLYSSTDSKRYLSCKGFAGFSLCIGVLAVTAHFHPASPIAQDKLPTSSPPGLSLRQAQAPCEAFDRNASLCATWSFRGKPCVHERGACRSTSPIAQGKLPTLSSPHLSGRKLLKLQRLKPSTASADASSNAVGTAIKPCVHEKGACRSQAQANGPPKPKPKSKLPCSEEEQHSIWQNALATLPTSPRSLQHGQGMFKPILPQHIPGYPSQNCLKRTSHMDFVALIISRLATHGIPCHLEGGSLLGAARHHGFIPWDTKDADLSVYSHDYPRIEAVLRELRFLKLVSHWHVNTDGVTRLNHREHLSKVAFALRPTTPLVLLQNASKVDRKSGFGYHIRMPKLRFYIDLWLMWVPSPASTTRTSHALATAGAAGGGGQKGLLLRRRNLCGRRATSSRCASLPLANISCLCRACHRPSFAKHTVTAGMRPVAAGSKQMFALWDPSAGRAQHNITGMLSYSSKESVSL